MFDINKAREITEEVIKEKKQLETIIDFIDKSIEHAAYHGLSCTRIKRDDLKQYKSENIELAAKAFASHGYTINPEFGSVGEYGLTFNGFMISW